MKKTMFAFAMLLSMVLLFGCKTRGFYDYQTQRTSVSISTVSAKVISNDRDRFCVLLFQDGSLGILDSMRLNSRNSGRSVASDIPTLIQHATILTKAQGELLRGWLQEVVEAYGKSDVTIGTISDFVIYEDVSSESLSDSESKISSRVFVRFQFQSGVRGFSNAVMCRYFLRNGRYSSENLLRENEVRQLLAVLQGV